MTHGRQYEKVAIEEFERQHDLTVKDCGMFILKDAPFLAATPDGLIGKDEIVEVKCPYTGRDSTVTSGKNFPFLTETPSGLKLKRNHKYYYQIQGQLFITKRARCYFIVYTFKDLFVEVIDVDTEYVQHSMLPRLQLFYEKYFRKFIVKNL